jgi:hypothetical protein
MTICQRSAVSSSRQWVRLPSNILRMRAFWLGSSVPPAEVPFGTLCFGIAPESNRKRHEPAIGNKMFGV